MANYTLEDIQNALAQNLISEEDAQYLAQELEPGAPVGGMMGGALGAAGLGAAGLMMGGKAGKKLADSAGDGMFGRAQKKVGDFMSKNMEGPDAPMDYVRRGDGVIESMPPVNMGNAMLGGAGTLAGGVGGAMAGDAMFPNEGEGVQGQAAQMPGGGTAMDRDMALRLLMDPNVPPATKKAIMQALQQADEANPPGEAGVGADSGMMGGVLGAGLGGLMGGAAGSKFGGRMGKAAGIGLGGLAGGGAGMMMDREPSPYAPKEDMSAYAEPL